MSWIILLFLVLPVPFFIGMIPVRYMNNSQKTPAMAYACGWFVSFFIFEIVAIPFILLEKSFTLMSIIYTIIIGTIFVYSVYIGIRHVIPYFVKKIKTVKELPLLVKLGWIIVFALIAFQMIYSVLYEYYDGDDSYYIATSVLTKTFDTMYLRDAYTGYIYPLDTRHAFSPTPVFQAWLSKLSGIGPAAVAHTVLAPAWLLFMYCIYIQIANRLLPANNDISKSKKNYRPVFMILICTWSMFGNVSLYTAETFAMTRTWQGKGLMAGMVIPALILCLLYLADDKVAKGTWIMFVCVIVSGAFATSVAFMLVPTIVGLASVFIGYRSKSIKKTVYVCLCCVPCLILGCLYILLS